MAWSRQTVPKRDSFGHHQATSFNVPAPGKPRCVYSCSDPMSFLTSKCHTVLSRRPALHAMAFGGGSQKSSVSAPRGGQFTRRRYTVLSGSIAPFACGCSLYDCGFQLGNPAENRANPSHRVSVSVFGTHGASALHTFLIQPHPPTFALRRSWIARSPRWSCASRTSKSTPSSMCRVSSGR
jgi:hypothetical protein